MAGGDCVREWGGGVVEGVLLTVSVVGVELTGGRSLEMCLRSG